MSILEIILACLLGASNYLWFVFFRGYRNGVKEAIAEHRNKYHNDEEKTEL